MPRYVKQKDKFRCGPVAIANAMKWSGENYSWTKNKDKLTKLCNCENGTYRSDLKRALKQIIGAVIKFRYSTAPTLRSIDEHLAKGAVLLNLTRWDEDKRGHPGWDKIGHPFLIIDRTPHTYIVVSYHKDKNSVHRITRKTLNKDLHECRWMHEAYYLTKRKR